MNYIIAIRLYTNDISISKSPEDEVAVYKTGILIWPFDTICLTPNIKPSFISGLINRHALE